MKENKHKIEKLFMVLQIILAIPPVWIIFFSYDVGVNKSVSLVCIAIILLMAIVGFILGISRIIRGRIKESRVYIISFIVSLLALSIILGAVYMAFNSPPINDTFPSF